MKPKSTRALLSIFMLLTIDLLFTDKMLSQNLFQTVRGKVFDKDTQLPLPGAVVVIEGTNPVLGASTNDEGNFKIPGVPLGRYNIQVSFAGYESTVIREIVVESGKEVVLSAGLKESTTELKQAVVNAYSNKDQPVNSMAMISARQLTMEEAGRYAGGIDDPSRLASSFAGVAGSLSSNAIVIRGNAPKGLQWRLEGVEIPNPSHFANVNTFGGGGITALSSQMLSNSDFYTGAFPAEYGNALSGVFDLKMRIGNTDRMEQTIKAGLIGLDYSAEGPFIKGKKSSYLFNYRYSTLTLLAPLLPQNAQGIRYQDLSFKLNFPAEKAGTFSIWGIGSADITGSKAKMDSTQWQYIEDMEKDKNRNRMGAFGVNHQVILNQKNYMHSSLSVSGNYIYWNHQQLDSNLVFHEKNNITQSTWKYTLSVFLNHKFNPSHTNRTGITIDRFVYSVNLGQSTAEGQPLVSYADNKGGSNLIQAYSQSRIDLPDNITMNAGIHLQYFTLNHALSVEPRAGIKWNFTKNQSVSLAYGLHSRLEMISYYLAEHQVSSGLTMPNKNLGFTKAYHLILSYDARFGNYTRLCIEPYFQRLFNVPVIPDSSFSTANVEDDWFFNDSLVNKGTGTNIGIDITLERFLNKGYYYLITLSLFNSKYTGGDGIERNSRFDKNVVFNVLFGKEWKVGLEGNNTLGVNGRFSVLGGDRISPVDYSASLAAKDVIYNENRAFDDRKPTIYYLDFSASFTKNRLKYSATWSFQFVNLLFQKEFFGYRYNFKTNTVDPWKEAIVIPNISYKVEF